MPALGAPYLRQVQAKVTIELHPSRCEDVKVAIREHLNGLLMRYDEEFGGVVLSYTDVVLLSRKGRILTGLSPYIHLDLTARLLVFAPAAQHVLVGSVNKVSPDHIGLLALGTFNGSIGADNIRRDFTYDHDASAWIDERIGGADLKVGTDLRFTVHRVHDEGSFLSFSGSVLAPGTGPLPEDDFSPEGREASRESKGGASILPPPIEEQTKQAEESAKTPLELPKTASGNVASSAGQVDGQQRIKKKRRREESGEAQVGKADSVAKKSKAADMVKRKH